MYSDRTAGYIVMKDDEDIIKNEKIDFTISPNWWFSSGRTYNYTIVSEDLEDLLEGSATLTVSPSSGLMTIYRGDTIFMQLYKDHPLSFVAKQARKESQEDKQENTQDDE